MQQQYSYLYRRNWRMIDSHCHVGIGEEWKSEGNNPKIILERAYRAGVEEILSVACNYTDISDLKQMLTYEQVHGAFGIHPENADQFDAIHLSDILDELPELVAVGEIGLDYFYNSESRASQIKAFEKQIEIASERYLPIIIHTRDAEADTVQILQAAERGGLLSHGGVLHCFTGSSFLAEQALDMGLYISASGIITFKKADTLRQIFQTVPLERLLVETDSPYLAPIPYRGKINEPAYVIETAKTLAQIKNLSFEEINTITTQNFKKLFSEGRL